MDLEVQMEQVFGVLCRAVRDATLPTQVGLQASTQYLRLSDLHTSSYSLVDQSLSLLQHQGYQQVVEQTVGDHPLTEFDSG